MKVAVLTKDLLFGSRILSAAEQAGATALRCDSPDDLPPVSEVDLLFVDWAARRRDWAAKISAWRAGRPDVRVILYGPHTDIEAHAAARQAGLGPMRARSAVQGALPELLRRP
ncbi:MAG TPA: hypothetical protein VFH63_03395 [candidate division Zixibacteria bacterium]|nr:hypothetical protein [candidate division Zixibacteria bacterium]